MVILMATIIGKNGMIWNDVVSQDYDDDHKAAVLKYQGIALHTFYLSFMFDGDYSFLLLWVKVVC